MGRVFGLVQELEEFFYKVKKLFSRLQFIDPLAFLSI